MKKSNISITALVILAVLAAASLVAVATADLGIEPCSLKDTYNNCLDSKYKIGGKPTLKVTEPPTFQNGVNVVQVTAPSRYLIEGEL